MEVLNGIDSLAADADLVCATSHAPTCHLEFVEPVMGVPGVPGVIPGILPVPGIQPVPVPDFQPVLAMQLAPISHIEPVPYTRSR
jgi:hypothetical protein